MSLTFTTGHVEETSAINATSTHQLHQKAKHFLTFGLAPTTRATYSTGWQKFTNFCTDAHYASKLTNTAPICLSLMANKNISHGTVKLKCISLQSDTCTW